MGRRDIRDTVFDITEFEMHLHNQMWAEIGNLEATAFENAFRSMKLDETGTVKPKQQFPNIPIFNWSYASINN